MTISNRYRPALGAALACSAALAAGCSDDDSFVTIYNDPSDATTRGALDASFGTGGRFVLDDAASSRGADAAFDDQGRILVAGSAVDQAGVRRLAVWRFAATGFIDPTFGAGGVFLLPTSTAAAVAGGSLGSCIAADGTAMVVAGSGRSAGGAADAIVVRIDSDGALDTSFWDGDDVAVLDLGREEAAAAVAVSGLHVLVAGSSREAVTSTSGVEFDPAPGAAFVARFDDGELDASYGVAGVTTSANARDRAAGMVLDGAGVVTLAGTRGGVLALFRLDADGSPDATFGTAGAVTLPATAGFFDLGAAIARRGADGSLAVAGVRTPAVAGAGATSIAAWRFDAAGRIVPGFGDGGAAIVPVYGGDTSGVAIAFDDEGRLLVAGSGEGGFPAGYVPDAQALLLRFETDGTPDESFAPGGILILDDVEPGRRTSASALLLDDGGRAVIAGAETVGGADANPILWRVVTRLSVK